VSPRIELMLVQWKACSKETAIDEVGGFAWDTKLRTGLGDGQPRTLVWWNWFDEGIAK
jgi:hypothetical protein